MKTCIFVTCNKGYVDYANFIAWQLQRDRHAGLEFVICSDDAGVGDLVLDGVRFVHLPDVDFFKTLTAIERLSYFTYLRLPAIEILAQEYDRILYLDTDVFVSRKGISEIFDLDLQGAVVGAVRDVQQRFKHSRKIAEFELLGYQPAPYLNAGVLLIDCAAWRRKNCYAGLLDLARKHSDALLLHDQTLLNLQFYKNWTEISPVWNWMANSKLNIWGEYFGARLIHTIAGRTAWKDVDGRLPRRLTSEYRLYCQEVGIPVPDNVEDHGQLYYRFMENVVLQLRYWSAIKRITARFPDDTITIRHSEND